MNIIESNLNLGNLSNLGTVKRIICHNADASNCSIYDIDRWHKNNGWAGCGYHFLVRKDGSIYRGRPENKLGAHTSNNNTGSLGICFEGKYNTETMPEAQLKAGQELIAYLLNKYNLTKANVYKHKDFNATDCPGHNFPWDKLINSISVPGNITVGTPATTNSWVNRLNEECKKQGFNGYPTVRKGAKGNITKIIQEILISLGYDLGKWGADGSFGDMTYKAIIKFQSSKGLLADGVVGQNTWRKLLNL